MRKQREKSRAERTIENYEEVARRIDEFDRTSGFWEEYQEPETYVYVIFREIGEEYPKLDENSTTIHEIEAPTISYSNGKLTFACATPDVTFDYSITSEDVKNGTGAEVELTGVYTVKVKAKRTGYKDLLEGGGEQNYDLNGDGKISTADIQVIINEMKK